jgi:tRNA(Ile2) C34 agmatinyltransferase TiaS
MEVIFDSDGYPMCGECGVELKFEGHGFYSCPICEKGTELDPPSASHRRRMREAWIA